MRIHVNCTFWLRFLLALICCAPFTNLLAQGQSGTSAAKPLLQPYGQCTSPSDEGVNVCMPYNGSLEQSPFQVIGAGTSGRGRVVEMEVWADGKKVTQSSGTPFDESVSLPPGDHELTLTEDDETGYHSNSEPFKVTVVENSEQPCAPPASPGVNVCEPMPNSCNTQPYINISAAATGATGPVVRMEVWINGAKVANFSGGKFETNMILFDTNYYMQIWEIDSQSHSLSKTLYLYGPC